MFSYKESDYFTTPSSLFNNLITESEEFNFNADDIIRIREEMRELLERLSIIYMPWKVEQDRKRAAKRRAEKPDKTRPKDAKLKENSNANNTCEHTQSRKFVTSSSGVQSLDMDITTDHSVGLSPSALKTDEPSLHFMLMNPAVGGNLELTFAAHVARPPPKAYLSQVEEVERNDFKSPSSARKPVIEQRVDRPGSRHEVEIDECSTEDI